MRQHSDIRGKIKQFVLNYFVTDSKLELNDDTSFLEAGIIDSTGVMELVAFIEVTFGVRLEDEEIIPDNFDSINSLVKCIELKLSPTKHTEDNIVENRNVGK